ncbi:hypothetical protein JAAARDRAFT_62776 [Jaapia argillacea MUCL 33604]|uniref:Uncharacterized protein n=1 Tax=Jaapia argillacea MUCL 33604 TaxID=933084 RepID=A0A067P805_9AGAM|nr:hypothetical protein JAAARDRAFT_62776 [Jaapia argillacea MUCL 33604]
MASSASLPFASLPKTGPSETNPSRQLRHVQSQTLSLHIAIVIGQLALMAFAWGFYGAIARYNQITLPDKLATTILTYPRATTAVVTTIATILSILSSLLCSRAVRYLLASRLISHRPVSFFSLNVGIELSKKSFVLNPRHPWWTLGTATFVVALSAQTAGWTTLLTPTLITVEVPINGTELNIGSPAFRDFVEAAYPEGDYYDYEVGGASSLAGDVISLPIDISGIASAGRRFGIPNTINYNSVTFNISTGGILPTGSPQTVGLNRAIYPSGLNFAGGPILSNYTMQDLPHAAGFTSNYSLLQQGFSADVSCQQRSLDYIGPAYLDILSYNFLITPRGPGDTNASLRNYTQWSWFLYCPDGTVQSNYDQVAAYGTDGLFWGNVCPFQNMSSTNTSGYTASSHLAVMAGIGTSYDFTNQTFCMITPKLTTVRVDYTTVVNVSETITSQTHTPIDFNSQYNISEFDIGQYTVRTFTALFYGSQSLWGNSIGNDILSLYSSQPQSQNGTSQEREALSNGILEDYLRGLVEFAATDLRSGYSTTGVFPDDKIPENMTISYHGTLFAGTMGWQHRESSISFLILIPMTVTAISSIVMVCLSLKFRQGYGDVTVRGKNGSPESFDPTHALHLILASSGRGLADAFDWEDFTRNEGMSLRLQSTSEGPALVEAGHSPSSDHTPLHDYVGNDGDYREEVTPSTALKSFQ